MFLGGLAISFYYGPIFTLVALSYLPVMIIVIVIFGKIVGKKMVQKLIQNKKLGGLTEETLSALKLVISFAQEDLTI